MGRIIAAVLLVIFASACAPSFGSPVHAPESRTEELEKPPVDESAKPVVEWTSPARSEHHSSAKVLEVVLGSVAGVAVCALVGVFIWGISSIKVNGNMGVGNLSFM